MTDKPTLTGMPLEVDETRQWRVEGGGSSEDERGLDDTVVRIDPIPANGSSAPTLPKPPALPPAVGPDYEATTALPAPPVVGPQPAPPQPAITVAPVPEPRTKRKLRRNRKARLRISRLDPWSVMKTTFLFSIAFGIMFFVAIYLLWSVIETSGLFGAINEFVVNLIANPNDTNPWRIEDVVSRNRVLGISAILAVANVVIITALGTIFAFLYNLSANVLGGLEVTLSED
ncbi:MAG: DUF3566 domain-containing protein [Propionicimonas sp.]|uniref:DUF3566 domain-containing protein n=1 Tax=Propionicimonas sp. TaxID=1955623 RepID=UPI002B204539|nr:DUF3566 domain-containing protein [Propionicimonas sp.]MEA4944435.1 DUF3566 domain-containing protein [Propionicimonas sp.]MEA5054844.1 DUF3566 domain-containing protein [Propionicimonas sp.]MEA5118070.1 DUF3566 domain-containing protein [Propionicimonas sp.]